MYETSRIQYQRGASVLSAIFLITGLAVLAALMTKLTIFGNIKSVKEWNGAQALYAAESAISAATYSIVTNSCSTTTTTGSVTINTTSSATYSYICRQPGESSRTIDLYEITANGTAGSGDSLAERQIVVQFIP